MPFGTVKLNDGNEVITSSPPAVREAAAHMSMYSHQMPVIAFGTGSKWKGQVRLPVFLAVTFVR